MPYDSNGNATVTRTIAVTGQTIQAAQVNAPFADIQAMLSQVSLRSGIAPMTGNINLNGFKLTGVANATSNGEVVTFGQLSDYALKNGADDLLISKIRPRIVFSYTGVATVENVLDVNGNWGVNTTGPSGYNIFYISLNGVLATKEMGTVSAYIEARALANANDRISKIQSRFVSQGNTGSSANVEVPSGAVVTGYGRDVGTSGEVFLLYYRYLQIFDPVRGWVGAFYA